MNCQLKLDSADQVDIANGLAQSRVQQHHENKAQHEASGGKGRMSFAVRLWNDLVADYKKHGACC